MRKILLHFLKVILGTLAFAVVSCSENKTEDYASVEKIKFHPESASSVFVEDIMEEHSFLPLETTTESHIGYIKQIIFTDSLMILTAHFQNDIFMFNHKGEFLHKISAVGHGPGEYSQLGNLIYDEKYQTLELYDASSVKVLLYDLNGKYIKEKRVNDTRHSGLELFKMQDKYVFDRKNVMSSDGMRLSVFDRDLNYSSSHLTIPKSLGGIAIGLCHPFETYQDSLFYIPQLDNKIYAVADDGATPVYVLDMPERFLATDKLINSSKSKDYTDFSSRIEYGSGIVHTYDNLFITDDYVVFDYKGGPASFLSHKLFYSKKTGAVKQYTDLGSRQNPRFKLAGSIIGRKGEYFVNVIDPVQFQILPDSIKDRLDENSNPTLMFFKLNEF